MQKTLKPVDVAQGAYPTQKSMLFKVTTKEAMQEIRNGLFDDWRVVIDMIGDNRILHLLDYNPRSVFGKQKINMTPEYIQEAFDGIEIITRKEVEELRSLYRPL